MNEGVKKRRPPEGWTRTTLAAIVSNIQPGFASGKHTSDGAGLPHLRPMNVTREGRIDRTDLRSVAPALADKPSRRLRRGDVLFNNTNSLELVGKTALFDDEDEPAFSNHMTRLRVRSDVAEPAFVAHLLHSRWRAGGFQRLANNHVSQASIARAVLASLPVELPPLAEQRRIAARLDQLGQREAAVATHLARAQSGLERYRSAVLGAACAGRLTADWRVDDAVVEGDGHDAPYAIPATWTWTHLESLLRDDGGLSYGILKPGDWDPDGIAMLRVVDIGYGIVNPDGVVRVSPEIAERYQRTRLEAGDIVLAIMATIGRAALVPDTFIGANVNRALAVIKLGRDVDNRYMLALILSPFFQNTFAARRLGSAQARINLGDLRQFRVPLPPLDEQQEIVRRSDAMLSRTSQLLERLEGVRRAMDQASRAAVAKAFRGELVPTEAALAAEEDGDFEPAEELLGRAVNPKAWSA